MKKYFKPLVFTFSTIPLIVISYKIFLNKLGPEPIKEITHHTGEWTLLFLIFTLASFFAEYIKKHQWLGYVGLVVILIIAIQLIIGGLVNMEVLSINEKYKFLFSI